MKMRQLRKCFAGLPLVLTGLGVVLLGAAASIAQAESPVGEIEVGLVAGAFLPDREVSGKSDRLDDTELLVGPRVSWLFSERVGWFFDATFSSINTAALGDADTRTARTGVDFLLQSADRRVRWFASAGGGHFKTEIENGADFDGTFAALGIGQRIPLDERVRLRWELRADRTLDAKENPGGANLTTPQLLFHLTWRLGAARDTDGDGVPDGRDKCPGTPAGAIVDADGCPIDSDGDGVWDGIDQCPDTPRGAWVDALGCPTDSDGDGVWDGIDRCPDTPRGARVDALGCPTDSDGDGVWDGIDQCPDTPRGVAVDSNGCPLDTDGDGVLDAMDRCPGTPPGTPVREDGCPKVATLFPDPEQRTLVLRGVWFDFDSARLTAPSLQTLAEVAQSLIDWPDARVEIAGHTDAVGAEDYNLRLSEQRAGAVMSELVRNGVPLERLVSRGYGETRPIASNDDEPGRERNRRVELTRLD